MSREIKFRGWDTKLKHMFPIQRLEFSKLNGELAWMSGVDIHHKESDYEGDVSFGGSATRLTGNPLVKRYHLMQYTGIKDTNGIEIYEGDQLFAPGNLDDELQYVGDVEWDEEDARWEVVNFYGRFEWIPNGCIVYGNIYQPKGVKQDAHQS